jgi:hypothetical protein
MLYRRFSFLHSRLLLHKQDELRELEDDLDRLDQIHAEIAPNLLKSREDDDALDRRRKLFRKVEEKFKSYGMHSCFCDWR